jgi:hypothetical protein
VNKEHTKVMLRLRSELQEIAWNVPGARDKASCRDLALIAMFTNLGIDWRTRMKLKFDMGFQSLVRFHKKNGHSHPKEREDSSNLCLAINKRRVKLSKTAFFLQRRTPS